MTIESPMPLFPPVTTATETILETMIISRTCLIGQFSLLAAKYVLSFKKQNKEENRHL